MADIPPKESRAGNIYEIRGEAGSTPRKAPGTAAEGAAAWMDCILFGNPMGLSGQRDLREERQRAKC
jgi:hypothetical protein